MPVNKDLKLLAHPYAFILKEGNAIHRNLLDYHLLMLQVNCPETIHSPKGHSAKIGNLIPEFDLYNSSIGIAMPNARPETDSRDF